MPFSIDGLPIVGRISVNNVPNRYTQIETEIITCYNMLQHGCRYNFPYHKVFYILTFSFLSSRLYVCTGMGGSGFGLGPMAGKLLADQMHADFNNTGVSTILPDIEKLGPNRFKK